MDKKLPEIELQIWKDYLKNSTKNFISKDSDNHDIINIKEILYLDLHGKTLKEAEILVKKSINFAKTNNIKKLEIITGIGRSSNSEFGTLYQETPKILELLKSDGLLTNYQRNKKNQGAILVKI
jgi:DNA-nicking Smr family endonuclease